MGASATFIAVCVAAMVKASPATMASLIIVSSLIQFLLADRVSLLRRVFTPTVAGTMIMLIAATAAPILFDSFPDVPEGASDTAAPLVVLATLIAVGALVASRSFLSSFVVADDRSDCGMYCRSAVWSYMTFKPCSVSHSNHGLV